MNNIELTKSNALVNGEADSMLNFVKWVNFLGKTAQIVEIVKKNQSELIEFKLNYSYAMPRMAKVLVNAELLSRKRSIPSPAMREVCCAKCLYRLKSPAKTTVLP